MTANMTAKPNAPKQKTPAAIPLPEPLASLAKAALPGAFYSLRIAEKTGRPSPCMEVRTRHSRGQTAGRTGSGPDGSAPRGLPPFRSMGRACGPRLTRLLPIIRPMLEAQRTEGDDLPMGMERVIERGRLTVNNVTLPVNEECALRLALIFKLQEQIRDLDRVELMARRAALFSREEVLYWHSRADSPDRTRASWALSGMRTMLAGTCKAKKQEILNALEALRHE